MSRFKPFFSSIKIVCLIFGIALVGQACEQEESEFAQSLQREWSVASPDGSEERVLFEAEQITYFYNTDKQYTCPYRMMSFSEKARKITILSRCKQRTGSNSDVEYNLMFEEDQQSFSLLLEKRNVGIYKAVKSR